MTARGRRTSGERDGRRSGRRSRAPWGTFLAAANWLVPPGLGLRLGSRVAGGSAWLAASPVQRALPELIREYPQRVAELFGEPVAAADARRLVKDRLAFLVARRLVANALGSKRGRLYLRAALEIDGAEHLAAAIARGKGAVLVSAHFGIPNLMRVVLARHGIRQVSPRLGAATRSQLPVDGDVWSRLGALRRFRDALGGGGACVVLADGRMGAPTEVAFFERRTTMALGAFYLGQAADCPVLPYFGLLPDHRFRLRVEIKPPLTAARGRGSPALAAAAGEFFAIYRSYARRYPSHLPHRLVRAMTGAPRPAR